MFFHFYDNVFRLCLYRLGCKILPFGQVNFISFSRSFDFDRLREKYCQLTWASCLPRSL